MLQITGSFPENQLICQHGHRRRGQTTVTEQSLGKETTLPSQCKGSYGRAASEAPQRHRPQNSF
jgi:hypothetical protein